MKAPQLLPLHSSHFLKALTLQQQLADASLICVAALPISENVILKDSSIVSSDVFICSNYPDKLHWKLPLGFHQQYSVEHYQYHRYNL